MYQLHLSILLAMAGLKNRARFVQSMHPLCNSGTRHQMKSFMYIIPCVTQSIAICFIINQTWQFDAAAKKKMKTTRWCATEKIHGMCSFSF